MKRLVLSTLVALVLAGGASAETRVSVTAELLNALSSGPELETWTFVPAGTAELSILNRGSRLVRSELLLRFSPTTTPVLAELERLYVRAGFGQTLVTVGKSRTSWGSGIALNAGDIVFGSSSVDFSLAESDPRSETAWLTSAEIPFGGFSFLELIALPGFIDTTDPTAPALPAVRESSIGGRVSVAVRTATFQAGYLYRGTRIAGLGDTGHHAYLSFEGYAPINWHISASARTATNQWDTEVFSDSLTVTAGAFDDVSLPADRTLSWQLESLVRPYRSFELDIAGDYGVYVYPGVTFVPRSGLSISLSSLISPVDLSARSAFAVAWNIYESLTLLSYTSVAAGEEADVFSINEPGGVSFTIGIRYVY